MVYVLGEILAVLVFLCLPNSIYESGRRNLR
jgi:hypothetical protein